MPLMFASNNKLPESTYRILKAKCLNEDIDESWIDWAIEMIENGWESNYLYMLAGMTLPFNQFELQQLTSDILHEFKLDYSDKDKVIKSYICLLVKNAVTDIDTCFRVLEEARAIYMTLNMESEYKDFYLLFWAYDDLRYSEQQYYWAGANRENIQSVVIEYFQKWIINHCQHSNHVA